MLKGVNWIAVLVAVVLLEGLGFLWYGPLFGERWAAALGKTPDTSNVALFMSLGVINTVIIVLGLSWLLRKLGAGSLQAAVMGALAAWFFFDFTTMAIDFLYVGHTAELVVINMGYQLVSYLIAGAVLGLIRPKTA
ncbi:DUF1761 domain-containing protein [Phenylobacterium sp.]|uniref:DUF1761 domain-containing protein n=1 Tax=Phenylobacterium sp. TaxID=1871053 RepID=UPI00286CFA48|nr:DUF1761 domain-containing protein [Phenylobacterium sp.]